jgi:hypothetical protein
LIEPPFDPTIAMFGICHHMLEENNRPATFRLYKLSWFLDLSGPIVPHWGCSHIKAAHQVASAHL